MIIDPKPFRPPMPFMPTLADAVKLSEKEESSFYVSAFMFHCWISQLCLDHSAQLAEKPDPADRFFQAGNAWRAFQKLFGKPSDTEFNSIFSHLMQFAGYDDPWAERLMHAVVPLSIEHELTGQFLGGRTPSHFRTQPLKLIALIRATVTRLCDWLDASLQFHAFVEWHIMPECFDPDPQKRELSHLAINQQNFDSMDDLARAHWLNHMSDAAEEMKNSPKWATYRQIVSSPPPQKRRWPNSQLDYAIMRLWPVLKHYDWAAGDLLFALRKILPAAALGPCPDESALITYCANSLSLRRASNRTAAKSRSIQSENQKSTLKNQKSPEPPCLNLAVRLCEILPPDDSP